jgi:hypothetical protein
MLRIASLTEFFEDYDLAGDLPLLVEWEPVGADQIRLRAQSLRPRLYYRMDGVQPMGAASYTWTPNILSALRVTRQDLGIVGWTQLPVGTTERFVYVPLRIRQQQDRERSTTYQLVLVPGRELDRVYVTLARVDENGNLVAFIRQAEELGYGYYPAGRGIPIAITRLGAPRLYYLEVGATILGGGSTTLELWFFHPGT